MTLPTVNARTMKLLLQHLYTGQSTFPHDDLNTWIDVSVTKYRTNWCFIIMLLKIDIPFCYTSLVLCLHLHVYD